MASGVSDSTQSSAEENNQNPEIILTIDDVLYIEKQLTSYEKVSMAFLFHDDVILSLRVSLNVLENGRTYVLYKYVKDLPSTEWTMKLLECLYRIKNYFVLQKFGLTKYDGMKRFNASPYLNSERVLLFEICESLTINQTKNVMSSLPAIPQEQYLEIWFLRVFLCKNSDMWKTIYSALNDLRNKNITQITAHLNIPIEKDIEKLSLYDEACGIDLPIIDNFYPIKDPQNVGLCVIIDNINFKVQSTRKGSDKDAETLRDTLLKFNFKIEIIKDCGGRNFRRYIQNVITEEFETKHSIFMIVLLSHGGNGYIIGVDEEKIIIEQDVYGALAEMTLLKNIPKIIIIQACQGQKFLIETDAELDNSVQADDDTSPRTSWLRTGNYIRDALIAFSTVPGFKSYRSSDTGSFFIQHLCKCLIKYPFYDIQEIMTKVIDHVAENLIQTMKKDVWICQYPQSISLLRKKLFLKIKVPTIDYNSSSA